MASLDSALSTRSGITAEEVDRRLSELRSGELLALLLAPDLEDSLTPAAIIRSNNDALFHLLPLVLSAIGRIGESPTRRDRFVSLVSALRMRIAACRGLKLRFLLLIRNAAIKAIWEVKLVLRTDCYDAARHVLEDASRDVHATESEQVFAMARQLTQVDQANSKDVAGWFNSKEMVVAFATRRLLHHERGIRRRTIKWHMRMIHSAFLGTELVDGIMERANFSKRDEAVALAQRLLDYGLIKRVGAHSHHFVDERRRVYQCHVAMQRDDAGHCRAVTGDGDVVECWDQLKNSNCGKISQIGIQIPMDMIDLQSYAFWVDGVYVKGAEKGYRYGYVAITHPLHCIGLDAKDQTASQNGNESNGSGSTDTFEDISFLSLSGSIDEVNQFHADSAVISSVVVRKVFSSIARPMIVELRTPRENANLERDDHHTVLSPGLLIKEGDNLMQDLGVETMFQCFNHVWAHSDVFKGRESEIPFSYHYEVFPTSPTQGFMEAVTGLTSLKEYNWRIWRDKYGNNKDRVNEMLRSTVGAYVGTYVCGGRDRHFDNVLIKDDKHLLHIDFGFLMGTSPPIDGPRIAIAPQMEAVFRDLKVWDRFVNMFVDAFLALRRVAPAIVRTSVIIFTKAGYEEHQIRSFIQGRFSLHVHEKEGKAAEMVRRQLVHSSTDIKTKFKAFAHEHIDPAWYGLLEKGFPPAVAIMKLVDAKEQKAAKKLTESSSRVSKVNENEKIHL